MPPETSPTPSGFDSTLARSKSLGVAGRRTIDPEYVPTQVPQLTRANRSPLEPMRSIRCISRSGKGVATRCLLPDCQRYAIGEHLPDGANFLETRIADRLRVKVESRRRVLTQLPCESRCSLDEERVKRRLRGQ